MKLIYTLAVKRQIDSLVQMADTEIGFLGLVRRIHDEKTDTLDALVVYELFVPTQEVTGVTVDADEEQLTEYMDALQAQGRTDEIANIQYFGHSHVNMACNPSPTDLECWRDLSKRHGPNLKYFIGAIFNKKGESRHDVHLDVPGHGQIKFSSFPFEVLDPELVDWTKAQLGKCKSKRHFFSKGYSGSIDGDDDDFALYGNHRTPYMPPPPRRRDQDPLWWADMVWPPLTDEEQLLFQELCK